MAHSEQGILGGFRGKIGPVVGCRIGDTFYMRSRPAKRSSTLSQKEIISRAAFALVQNWLSPIKPVLQTGFHNYGSKTGGFRAAFAWHRKHAVAGEYPDQYIDLNKVKLSGGDLPGAGAAAVTVIDAVSGTIHNTHNAVLAGAGAVALKFSWSYDEHDLANPYDQVMIVAYNTTRGEAVYKTTGNFRKDREDMLQLPDLWLPDTIHCWLSFIAADRGMQSESVYLGVVEW